MVVKGLSNLAFEKPVISSDKNPTIGEISQVTDGDKEGHMGSYVELGAERQWVQVDLGAKREIHAIVFWLCHSKPIVYKDVTVQTSNDADFITDVNTIFNNDLDNSSGIGIGEDYEFYEVHQGKLVDTRKDGKPLIARYVRIGSNGNTIDETNRFTEVEVWGRAVKGK